MVNSILDTIKYLLGGEALKTDTSFDPELIIHINGVLSIMTELGVGPKEGFILTSKDQSWEEFLGIRKDLEIVKNAVYLRVRLLFDPPTNSFLVAAIERQIVEYDWRIESWHDPALTASYD